jgi:ribosomal protein L21E
MEENRIPKRLLYINFETTKLRGRPRNRWQDEVRECGRVVGGEEWQVKVHVYNREERKKLLRMASDRHILHMAME